VDADAATFTKEEEANDETKKRNEEAEKALKTLFEEATGNKELEVKLQTLTDEDTSALLVQDEQGRRFSDMSRIYGQDFKMPERHTLVLNRADAAVQRLLAETDAGTKTLIAAQLYDLARMSVRPLEKEEITAFLARSNKLLKMVK
jgi:molecular chaperone HtpG